MVMFCSHLNCPSSCPEVDTEDSSGCAAVKPLGGGQKSLISADKAKFQAHDT